MNNPINIVISKVICYLPISPTNKVLIGRILCCKLSLVCTKILTSRSINFIPINSLKL